MNLREFQTTHKEFCNRYNENLDLYYRCAEYLENNDRTPQEVEKYTKILNVYAKTLSSLLEEYKTLNGTEMSKRITLGGFLFYEKVS